MGMGNVRHEGLLGIEMSVVTQIDTQEARVLSHQATLFTTSVGTTPNAQDYTQSPAPIWGRVSLRHGQGY